MTHQITFARRFPMLTKVRTLTATPFQNEEDGGDYAVYDVYADGKRFVLKRATPRELSVYRTYLSDLDGVPHLFDSVTDGEDCYLLLEYLPGTTLSRCTGRTLDAVLDVLISHQQRFWGAEELPNVGVSFADAMEQRKNRGRYLGGDAALEEAYRVYLHHFSTLPRTLCHDDLLPFNCLADVDANPPSAAILDWEHAGIFAYPTPLARLLAHTGTTEDAFFFMTEEDYAYAIETYYEKLIAHHGISYSAYRQHLDSCLLYEYCEWIMLGNKYADANMERFHAYREKAMAHIRKMT